MDISDRLRQEALIVTHPRHKQVLLDALDEIERLRADVLGGERDDRKRK